MNENDFNQSLWNRAKASFKTSPFAVFMIIVDPEANTTEQDGYFVVWCFSWIHRGYALRPELLSNNDLLIVFKDIQLLSSLYVTLPLNRFTSWR